MAKEKDIATPKYKVIDGVISLRRTDYYGNPDCINYGVGSIVELSDAEYKGVSDKVKLIDNNVEEV